MKRIHLFVYPDRCTIGVQNGTERDVTAPSVTEAIRALHPDDLGPVIQLATAIIEAGLRLRQQQALRHS